MASLVNGIFWQFNDGVLWFVRAIIKLYFLFFFYRFVSHFKPLFLALFGVLAVGWIGEGFVNSISILLFFAGVSVAQWGNIYYRMAHTRWCMILISIVLFVPIVLIVMKCFSPLLSAKLLHALFNIIFIFVFLALLAYKELRLKVPPFISACSYDVYLVHNKVLMYLRPVNTVLPLFPFIGLTIIVTFLFYYLRKMLHIG